MTNPQRATPHARGQFQSTSSVWRETYVFRMETEGYLFQSTPSVWRETCVQELSKNGLIHFNPLPPCGGRPHQRRHLHRSRGDFNPLPPCGGRRRPFQHIRRFFRHFNPLPPCGGRPIIDRETFDAAQFQSTPSVWRETCSSLSDLTLPTFQSTPSVWRETFWEYWKRGGTSYFNPLPPCGGRHVPTSLATLEKISIHSLRVEGDRRKPCSLYCLLYFNPLPPCGGRPCCGSAMWNFCSISIHSLRVEGDPSSSDG